MTKLLTLMMILATGCGLDAQDDDALGSVEQDVASFLTVPQNYYYTVGGVTWFQDDFSGKWCTGATVQSAVYDYDTTCGWLGWRDSYHQYCDGHGAFWQNLYFHYHCP
jgi:hypothetical protein